MKDFILADANTFICKHVLYRGLETEGIQPASEDDKRKATERLVTHFLEKYSGQGHHIMMDTYYGSDTVSAQQLQSHSLLQTLEACKAHGYDVTMICSACRSAPFRDYLSSTFDVAKDQTWNALIAEDNSAIATTWNDKKQVHMLSTTFGASGVKVLCIQYWD